MQDNSTPELSDDDPILSSTSQSHGAPTTPIASRTQAASELSPPDSRGQSTSNIKQASPLAGAMSSGEGLNANGKRTLDAATGVAESTAPASSSKGKYIGQHPAGYTWDKEEDAPGYLWNNEKAQQEALRALNQIIDTDQMIKGRVSPVLSRQMLTRIRTLW